MAQVVININNREYPIACENGQEPRIMQLAQLLEQKAQTLSAFNGKISENLMLAMIGILVADDLFEARKNSPAPASQPQSVPSQIPEKLKLIEDKIKVIANLIESL